MCTGLADILRLAVKAQIWRHPAMRSPHRMRNALFGNPARGGSPAHLQVEISSLCNLACSYCQQHAGKNRGALQRSDTPSGFMAPETFTAILDRYPNALTLQLQGQGEPLLSPHFEAFVRKARGRGMLVYTVSNGTLLHERQQRAVLESGLDAYFVSLDIASPEEMERTRLGMRYDRIAGNVRRLREERDARHSPLLVGISAVVKRSDMPLLEETVRHYDAEIRPDLMVIAPLATCDAATQDYSKWYPERLREEVMDGLAVPRMPGVKAVILTSKALNRGRSCRQTMLRYFHYDGTAAYCQIRHKTTVEDPDTTMREAAAQMQREETPLGCRGCSYLPKG